MTFTVPPIIAVAGCVLGDSMNGPFSRSFRMAWFTQLSFALAVAAVIGSQTAGAAELKEGDEAPAFELQGSDGKTYKLSDFKGKKAVVVAWFPKAFTGGCTKECKSMREHGKAIKEFDVAYFTASCDPVDGEKGNAAFAKSLDLDYPILCDPERKAAKEYGLVEEAKGNAKRVTFYISKEGKILAIDKMVKTDAHGTDIAAKLKELGVAKAEKK
jgi:peroxiredoxin Q/BCP